MHGNVSLDLSTASVAELRQSLNELSQGQTIQPASDFPDRFVSRRGTHIQVVQQSEIVPEKFFRNGIHQKYELPPVNFTRAEQNMSDDYVRLGYWAWSVPVQTTVDRAGSASLSAFLSESAVPRHEGSVSGSNDPVSADLNDDTSSLQLGSRLTEGNPGGGAFPGDGEQLPRVNIDQADGMSRRAQTHNEQEPVSLQTVVDILRGFETKFNQIEGRFSDFNDRFSSLNQAIGRDMRSLKTEMWNGEQRVETRLNAKVAAVESSVKLFDDKVMQKFKTMEDSIDLLSDSVRAVSVGGSGASQTVSGAVPRSQQPQGIGTVSSLAVTSQDDDGSNAAGGCTAPRRPTFVSVSDVAETTPVSRAPADRSVSIAEPLLQSTMVSAPRAAVGRTSWQTPVRSEPIFALGNYIEDRLSAIYNQPVSSASISGNSRPADMVGVRGLVTNGVYRPREPLIPAVSAPNGNNGDYRSHEPLITAVSASNVNNGDYRPHESLIPPASVPNLIDGGYRQRESLLPMVTVPNVTRDVGPLYDYPSRNTSLHNSSLRVKDPASKLPTFDAARVTWNNFIQDFEDLVSECGWQGQEISKFKFCLSGKAKEVYRSLPGGYQNNYELVKAQFTAMFGVVDDERSSALKLYSTKQREDQDLNSFIVDITLLANKAFPKDPLMANMRAKEAFLKGCKNRREAWVVINNGRCATFAEATAEVRRLLEDYSVNEGQGENLQIRAFSQMPNASVQDGNSLRKFSPTRVTSKFSPRNSPTWSENYVTSPVKNSKEGLSDVMEQLKAIRGDYARMDGKISELKNQVDIIGDAKNSSDQRNPRWVAGGDRGPSSMHNNYGRSPPPKRASSASPDRKSGLASNVCFYCQEPGHFIRECPHKASPRLGFSERLSPGRKQVTFGGAPLKS